jgi:hypothetical protein
MFTMDELPRDRFAGGGGGASGSINYAKFELDYCIIGGGGTNGNGNVGGGEVMTGRTITDVLAGGGQTITIGAVGAPTNAIGITARAGQNGSNAGGAHWGWDGSTNCDAWPGGPGGLHNGAVWGPGANPGGPDVHDYYAAGGKGGDGYTWAVTAKPYAGGLGGQRGGAGVGNPGANGLGAGDFGGGNRAGGAIFSYISDTQLLDGGTVSTSGGRYFHTFSTSGKLIKYVKP